MGFLKGSTDPRQVETSVASHGWDNVSPVQPQEEGPFRRRDFFIGRYIDPKVRQFSQTLLYRKMTMSKTKNYL